jgi:hypothetical protein
MAAQPRPSHPAYCPPRFEVGVGKSGHVSSRAVVPTLQIVRLVAVRCDVPFRVMPLILQSLFYRISSGGRALSGEASVLRSPSAGADAKRCRKFVRSPELK